MLTERPQDISNAEPFNADDFNRLLQKCKCDREIALVVKCMDALIVGRKDSTLEFKPEDWQGTANLINTVRDRNKIQFPNFDKPVSRTLTQAQLQVQKILDHKEENDLDTALIKCDLTLAGSALTSLYLSIAEAACFRDSLKPGTPVVFATPVALRNERERKVQDVIDAIKDEVQSGRPAAAKFQLSCCQVKSSWMCVTINNLIHLQAIVAD